MGILLTITAVNLRRRSRIYRQAISKTTRLPFEDIDPTKKFQMINGEEASKSTV